MQCQYTLPLRTLRLRLETTFFCLMMYKKGWAGNTNIGRSGKGLLHFQHYSESHERIYHVPQEHSIGHNKVEKLGPYRFTKL